MYTVDVSKIVCKKLSEETMRFFSAKSEDLVPGWLSTSPGHLEIAADNGSCHAQRIMAFKQQLKDIPGVTIVSIEHKDIRITVERTLLWPVVRPQVAELMQEFLENESKFRINRRQASS